MHAGLAAKRAELHLRGVCVRKIAAKIKHDYGFRNLELRIRIKKHTSDIGGRGGRSEDHREIHIFSSPVPSRNVNQTRF